MLTRGKMRKSRLSISNSLVINTRRLSIPIKRLYESETAEIVKSPDSSLLEVEKWQQEIYDHLNRINHLGVLGESDRVFNMKEAYFPLVAACPAAQFLTALIVIGASGVMAPTTVFFPNNELPPRSIFADETNTANFPEDYSSNDKLLSYMALTFLPWLISKHKTFPVIVFIDIDPVHISWDFLTFCKENEIILLRTTTTLSLHPISSFVLPRLENAWTCALLEWNSKNESRQIASESVPSILGQVLKNTITADLLIDGFRKCGTFPFDPVTVYKQGMASSSSVQILNSISECMNTLRSITEPDHIVRSISGPDHTLRSITESDYTVRSIIEPDNADDALQSITPPSIVDSPMLEISRQKVISEAASFNDTNPIQQATVPVPEQTIRPAPQSTQTTNTVQPTPQFQVLLGPLTYEFINAGNSWNGAIENTSLFQVWKRLLKPHQQLIHSPTTHARAQEANRLFRKQFEGLIGPLMHDFKNSGSIWMGATENRGLFEVWKEFMRTLEDKNNGQYFDGMPFRLSNYNLNETEI